MSNNKYQIVINEAQRRLIMRALTNAIANDRRSSDALSPPSHEWMQLIRLFSMIKAMPCGSNEQISGVNEQIP
jgi:hypothetical protein